MNLKIGISFIKNVFFEQIKKENYHLLNSSYFLLNK